VRNSAGKRPLWKSRRRDENKINIVLTEIGLSGMDWNSSG
jgi:hypothetical protein